MKGLIALLLVALLAVTLYNGWQIRSMREDIARMEQKVQQQAGGLTDQMVAQAAVALARAREALAHADTDRARAAFDDARRRLDDAARVTGDRAGPTVRWLQDQATDLGRRLEDRVRANR